MRPNAKHRWQLQEAKARLSELVKKAGTDGPQEITVRGQPAAVVLSAAAYDKLRGKGKPANLADFLLDSPLAGLNLKIDRDRSHTRATGIFDDEQ